MQVEIQLKNLSHNKKLSKRKLRSFFSVSTKEFIGDKNGNLKGLVTTDVEWILKKGNIHDQKKFKISKSDGIVIWFCWHWILPDRKQHS